MAKQRYVNTKFWSDNYIVDLDPLERYLFLYYLTNEHTNIAGMYELPLKVMSRETGLEVDMLKTMLKRFENDEKIFYIDNHIVMKNFAKHQAVNEKTKKGIERSINELSPSFLAKLKDIGIGYATGMDGVSMGVELSKPKPKLEPKLKVTSDVPSQVNPIIGLFKEVNPSYQILYKRKPQRAAIERLLKKFPEKDLCAMIQSLTITNKEQYAPTVTTPMQLEEKLGQLKAFWDKRKANKPKVANI